ncbi:MAG: hypothetical protein MUF36_06405 [Bacteroidales bacterium]|jgi:hypothetical protein|nr:hypothetical protein [Bacteroidales bacterium]
MKNFLVVAITFIFISLQVYGQKPVDTLYLKNGSVAYGKIVEKSKDVFLIKTAEGFRFSFTPDQVDRYFLAHGEEKAVGRPHGLGFTMQSGMLIGSGEELVFLLFSFTPMITYTINEINSISIGTGAELYEEVMMPLFAEYKLSFTRDRLSPFYYIKGGALFNYKSDEGDDYYNIDYLPGHTFGTGLGLSWPFGKYDSYVQLGYRHAYTKQITSYQGGSPDTYTYRYHVNRFDITFGFKF